ncbi:hypothetical protein MTR67_003264 [Solanum verrucosum]|uniref:Uncharacterized protein n=1 Tax=Solanum verrucosum TaxID=315347 RepID=A0AAF0T9I6_SOLVR|nr:hypothetical protein MTR67_003264 [Solanum verrucosum]
MGQIIRAHNTTTQGGKTSDVDPNPKPFNVVVTKSGKDFHRGGNIYRAFPNMQMLKRMVRRPEMKLTLKTLACGGVFDGGKRGWAVEKSNKRHYPVDQWLHELVSIEVPRLVVGLQLVSWHLMLAKSATEREKGEELKKCSRDEVYYIEDEYEMEELDYSVDEFQGVDLGGFDSVEYELQDIDLDEFDLDVNELLDVGLGDFDSDVDEYDNMNKRM